MNIDNQVVELLNRRMEVVRRVGEIKHQNNGDDVVLVSEFESVEALYSYQKHPDHLKVADFVSRACTSRAVVDYVI